MRLFSCVGSFFLRRFIVTLGLHRGKRTQEELPTDSLFAPFHVLDSIPTDVCKTALCCFVSLQPTVV